MSFVSSKHPHPDAAKFFPVPKFLEMPFAGVDISEGAIRAVKLEKTAFGFHVEKYFEQVLPPGTILSGSVERPGPIAEAIRALRRAFKVQFVKVSLPDEKTYLFRADVPFIQGSDLKESIEFLLEENVPLNPTDALFEYAVMPGTLPHERIPVIVSVVPKDVVSSYLSLFHSAGLLPISFEIRSQALANAVLQRGDMRATLLVHIGHSKTTIAVVQGGAVQFSSVVAVGGTTLTAAVARTFSVSNEEASQMKEKKSFINTTNNQEFFSSLLSSVSVIKDEMRKVNGYWEDKVSDPKGSAKKIERIILSGKNAAMSGLREHMALEMNKKVDVANIWTNVASQDVYIPPISLLESLSFASTVGLALPWPVSAQIYHA
ncbi:MAG: pilus assembly protein PilM [Candidatus Pacebacteria bacterium]|nr:pilus assembly protein PilM [Candidatus Paceibacterota bacterium]MDD5356874.1 pilus assembly protein PilM [Candidatus Paceibacterota bacterium]